MDDAMRITAPANLPSLVRTAFSRAAASGDLTYYQTQVALLTSSPTSAPFQLRFSPALASKPKNNNSNSDKGKDGSLDKPKKKPFNPFANPDPALLITVLPPPASHTLVLNKFAIVPEHFILITNAFKPQTHLLEADDLEAAYACVRAYHEDAVAAASTTAADTPAHESGGNRPGGSELFVFFNSGPHSGASQPHRHLQLLPIESMRVGLDDATGAPSGTQVRQKEWTPLINTLVHEPQQQDHYNHQPSDRQLGGAKPPFEVFSTPISAEMSASDRHAAYVALYHNACAAMGEYNRTRPGLAVESAAPAEGSGTGEARISYNLAMTNSVMALCPRLAEGSAIYGEAQGEGRGGASGIVGKVELNGTVLAGTALVKNEAEWDALRKNPEHLFKVLRRIGIPSQESGSGHSTSFSHEAAL
ncbi:ATP adenylyltransferase-domain-containing protein [Microdochium bolleyi]|uniref:ATP adenylyltransferase-domain-containing protein n=1 Tax=Microdochium bolleyi TaxID=196109 RepID=A0A136JAR3_9PEZI|nr:ATP adenylyltransferase-domain-containing protein [Microdochium bolleyi]